MSNDQPDPIQQFFQQLRVMLQDEFQELVSPQHHKAVLAKAARLQARNIQLEESEAATRKIVLQLQQDLMASTDRNKVLQDNIRCLAEKGISMSKRVMEMQRTRDKEMVEEQARHRASLQSQATSEESVREAKVRALEDELRQELSRERGNYQRLKEQYEEEVRNNKQISNINEKQINKLRELLAERSKQIEQARLQSTQDRQTIEKANSTLAERQFEFSQLQTLVQSIASNLDSMAAQRIELTQKVKKLEEKSQMQESKCTNMEKQKRSLEIQVAQLLEENIKLRGLLSQKESGFIQLLNNQLELQEKINKLTKDLEEKEQTLGFFQNELIERDKKQRCIEAKKKKNDTKNESQIKYSAYKSQISDNQQKEKKDVEIKEAKLQIQNSKQKAVEQAPKKQKKI